MKMDQPDLRLKYQKVTAWLESLSDDDNLIPNYEVTEQTLHHLERLKHHNEKQNKLGQLYLGDVNTKCTEYQRETNRLKGSLDTLGLPVYTLSSAGKSSCQMLSRLAGVLKVRDVKRSTYVLALNEFNKEHRSVLELCELHRCDIDKQLRQAKQALKSLEHVAVHYRKLAEYVAVDAPVAEKKRKEIVNFQSKCDVYKKQLSEDIHGGEVSAMDKQLSHAALLRLHEDLKVLQEELRPLEERYQTYRSLPPDVQLAKVKIEETKRYLKKLESELDADIDYFSL